jgi:hypothetical protein
MKCGPREEKASWTDLIKNEEVLHRVKVDRNTLNPIKRRKAKGIGHIRRGKYLLKEVIEGRVEGLCHGSGC